MESPTGAFAPFVVHYAETFIVPAPVGRYRIRPHGAGVGRRLATIKAFVAVRSEHQRRDPRRAYGEPVVHLRQSRWLTDQKAAPSRAASWLRSAGRMSR